MAINLEKGQKIDLTKNNPSLDNLMVGLGWDTQKYTGGSAFDLDSCVAMTKGGTCGDDDDFVYFSNLKDRNGAVIHSGDNLTGAGDGDDEVINIELSKVPADIESLDFHVVIYSAEDRNQNFGQVSNAFVRIVNKDTNEELIRYDLGEDFSTSTRMHLGSIYRHNGEWKFQAVGGGSTGGFKELLQTLNLK